MIPTLVGGALFLLFSADTLRIRGRARALEVLAPSDEPPSPSHVFLARPGVTVDDETRRAASAHARRRGLMVIDLVPRRLAAWRALVLLAGVDPKTYRQDRLTPGASAGDALLVDAEVLRRARHEADVGGGEPKSALDLVALARVLKRYAATTSDLAVAPALVSPGLSLRERRRLLRMSFSDLVGPILALQQALLAGTVATAPLTGRVALAAHNLQAALGTLGTPLAPPDLLAYALFRPVVDGASAFGPLAPSPRAVTPDSLRPTYAALLEQGTTRFFEPPRDDCPLCGGKDLAKVLSIGDAHQHKPGTFTVVRCLACDHRFQNPRLSLEGLSFYYRDFYDGLGAETLEALFSSGDRRYLARARFVESVGEGPPKRWLDVGAGHGHFCHVVREHLPHTSFDGLDLSDSIALAERRGWVTKGIQGLFPETAPKLAEEGHVYDVVSMSHYLEHTVDPRAEIAAAARVLRPGGVFFVEVPDPESGFAKLLGARWMPWLQPQHLHFLTVKNLERLLRESGFTPVAWQRGEAHQASDFFYFTYMALERAAPATDLPWRERGGALARAWRRAAWALGIPALGGAWALDKALAPLARRPGWSNAYRVVARKD